MKNENKNKINCILYFVFEYELGVLVRERDKVCAAQRDKDEPDERRHHVDHVYSPIEP